MITEDHVSFETAKLLKEKGFDEDIDLWYDEDGEVFFKYKYDIRYDYRVRQNQNVYQCPTLQMAMKWLRKIYHIHIRLINSIDESYRYEIYPREGKYRSKCFTDSCYYETYEQACEVAIKQCLDNLI